jgi:hypothetical protein
MGGFIIPWQAKAAWDAKLEAEPSSEGTIIEVQHWSVSNSFTPKQHLLISGNGQDELHLVSSRFSVNYAKLTFHNTSQSGYNRTDRLLA